MEITRLSYIPEVTLERTLIKDILQSGNAGEPVNVCGWVRSRRESKDFALASMTDRHRRLAACCLW
jgi:aspartyl/asparaginyl-tRNA synthetase